MPDIPILTIDGPSGSGKGTITRLVAERLGWHILDSGALYRVLALYLQQHHTSFDDHAQMASLARKLPVKFGEGKVLLEGIDVSKEIRTEECGALASKIAAIPVVREALLDLQHSFSKLPGLVADGRDMGTVVFPFAFLKIYLDASAEERAKRRYLQLKQAGFDVKLSDLAEEILQRDIRDKSRAVAPLKPASDAVVIDTSNMSIDEVFEKITDLAQQYLSKL